jgi:hypothetical protein
MRKATTLGVALALALFCAGLWAAAETDPLPSWNDTGPKQAILKFVAETTQAGSPSFIPPAERIATFDNDDPVQGREGHRLGRTSGRPA